MSDDDYPTDGDLAIVQHWDFTDPLGWFNCIHDMWWMPEWGWREIEAVDDIGVPVMDYWISTGGWSGNESIIEAMRENSMLWAMTWESNRRGGHYVFRRKR